MSRESFDDLLAFIAVARERSFTRAAAQLGISQSALSQIVRTFEAKLGVRLLTRTTRSVSPTEAGERLLQTASPRFDEVKAELQAIAELRDRPSGTIRITATDYAANVALWPRLIPFLEQYPDIKVEINIDYGLADIVSDQYDLGVRQGDELAEGMIAARIAPDIRFIVVGAPSYLDEHEPLITPHDLTNHNCINLRLPTRAGLYAWELKRGNQETRVRVDGQLVLNSAYQILYAAQAGRGLAFLPEDIARPFLDTGKLRIVLEDWCPTFPGLHLYYASRRQSSRALSLLIEALRHQG